MQSHVFKILLRKHILLYMLFLGYLLWYSYVNCLQGAHTSMNEQVANFGTTVQQLRRFFRGDNDSLNSYINQCLFFSGMGSNDYLNNYFMPDFYSTSSDFTVKAFASALLQDYSRQLSVCSHLILNDSTFRYCISIQGHFNNHFIPMNTMLWQGKLMWFKLNHFDKIWWPFEDPHAQVSLN